MLTSAFTLGQIRHHRITPVNLKGIQIAAACVFALVSVSIIAKAQTSNSAFMTRDEVRQCMNQEDRILTRLDSVNSETIRSNEEAAAIATESATLIRMSVNGFKNKAELDVYNQRSIALNKRIVSYNAKSKQVHLLMADIQTSQAEHIKNCGGRRFHVEDKDFILDERESAIKLPKTTEVSASAPVKN